MTLLSQKITKPNLNTNTWKCKKNRWKINYWRCCEMAKKRWKEVGERAAGSFWASLTILRIQEKSTKIKDQEYWNQMIENHVVRWQKEVKGRWRVASWLLLSKSHLLRIQEKSTKIKDQVCCNPMIKNHVVRWQKKGWKEDGERLVGSLQVPVPVPVLTPFQFEYRKKSPKSKIKDIV